VNTSQWAGYGVWGCPSCWAEDPGTAVPGPQDFYLWVVPGSVVGTWSPSTLRGTLGDNVLLTARLQLSRIREAQMPLPPTQSTLLSALHGVPARFGETGTLRIPPLAQPSFGPHPTATYALDTSPAGRAGKTF
jgi:hypothetical protein